MEYADVNLLAKRIIRSGNEYNKYFVDSSCKPVFLAQGDTYVTISEMKKWAYQFKDQTKKLALSEFFKLSLSNTASKIYDFLYNHLQYELDGNRQNLKSPACAWATREKGTDCKTYSIFASTILQNLGIKHYFRKVKQPRLMPDKWTHVYVIIPINQNSLNLADGYYTIDATVKPNIEVQYSEKNDMLMSKVSLPHYGLQAPAGLGACSCHAAPQPSNRTGTTTQAAIRAGLPVSEAAMFDRAVINLKKLLADLRKRGLSADQENEALVKLQQYINIGKEPKLIDLFLPMPTGLGITGELLLDINQLPITSSARGGSNVNALTNTPKVTGVNVSSALSLVTSIIPKEIYEKTFGALFANGFNFKCWGATWNPAKAEKILIEVIPQIQAQAAAVLQLPWTSFEKGVNDFLTYFYSVHSTSRNWLNTSAKDCTKDGLAVLIGGLNNTKIKIKEAFEQHARLNGHNLTVTTSVKKTYPPEAHTGRHALTTDVEQYKFTYNAPPSGSNIPVNQTAINNLTPTYVDPNGNLVMLPNIPTVAPQEAGFGFGAIVLLALAAAGTVYYTSKNK